MILSQEEDRRANRATAFSMMLAVVLVVVAVSADAKWSTALWMIVAGLAPYVSNNLICLAVAKQAFLGAPWAVLLIRYVLWPLVPIGVALYLAGIFTLIIIGLKAGWSTVFG